jgi:hypothetical protein
MKSSFSKEHTLITKGILIIMLLAHHVFAAKSAAPYEINTVIHNTTLFYNLAIFCRICIAGFAFLTAYGMTQSFQNAESDDPKSLLRLTVRRLIKLETTIIPVYLLAVLYKRFVMLESLQTLYREEGQSLGAMALHMLLDMTGLSHYTQTPKINVTWWYLSYAILLIVAMPFIYMAYKKFRYLLIPAGCLLPYAIFNSEISFALLLPVAVLGTAFSYENLFDKLRCRNKKQAVTGLALCAAMIYAAYLLHITANATLSYTLAAVIPYVAYEYVSKIPGVRTVLKFLGRYATNMFLTHTFIYYYFYTDFIYSFHYAPLILLVLIVLSLLVSIAIELIKKWTGYDRICSKILNAVEQRL